VLNANNHEAMPERVRPPSRVEHVSLVIPVRDESGTIGELLTSIRAQTQSPDEIIFVDGGSTDATVGCLRAAAAEDARIRFIETQGATPGRGRNLGISAATNDWIALTDAGIRLEPTWLERLVAAVDCDPTVAVVFGNYEPMTDTFFESCAATAYVEPSHPTPMGLMRGPFIASCLLKRDVWRMAGGFPDVRASEDLIFIERVQSQGAVIAWAPTAMVWWRLRPTLYETFRRFVSYSKHNVWAGRQRYWHYGIARQYVGAVAILALAALQSRWWLAALVVAIMLRIGKTIWRHRQGRRLLWLFNPARFVLVGVILATIDLATFIGWALALGRHGSEAQIERTGVRD
jgi:glycosyltransferase involved in cell wall biosynthesis